MVPGQHASAERRGRSWPQRLIIAIGVFVVFVCVLSAGALGYGYARFASITRYDVKLVQAASGGPANYLVVGSDSRENLAKGDPDAGAFVDKTSPTGGKRSDTIMILRIDPTATNASILSLPRDLYVPIAGGRGKDRINSAYGLGRQVLIDTIEMNFGIVINHYVEVDFNGFKGLVRAIDGIPLYFEQPVRDTNTGLRIDKPGCVTLDPTMALAFARSRHLEYRTASGWKTDPTADLGRITRQQIFIRRAMSKALSKGVTNPVTLNNLVGVAVDNVGLDPALGASDIISLGKRFGSFNPETLVSYTVPSVSKRTAEGAAVQEMVELQAEPLLNIFRGLPPGSISPKLITVAVLNGSGQAGQGPSVAAAFEQLGFKLGKTGVNTKVVKQTTVYYGPGSADIGRRVLRHISGAPALALDKNLGADVVRVVTGTDFTTIHADPAPEPPTTTTTAPAVTGSTTTTTAPTTTSSTVIGKAVGVPPPGVTCG
jgi:LCP family protein required for cell wall assembly